MPLRRFALNLAVLIFVVLASEGHRYGDATWYVISMWVMTFLVLALMLYNQGIDAYHKRKRNRRLALLYALAAAAFNQYSGAPENYRHVHSSIVRIYDALLR